MADPGWQDRLIEERRELAERQLKLKTFIEGDPAFKALPSEDKALLRTQLAAMNVLGLILDRRIAKLNLRYRSEAGQAMPR